MKKITSLFICFMLAMAAKAQTVSFTLTQAPCNNDGILTATFTGLTPPLSVDWNIYNQPTVNHTVNVLTDALTNYSGAYLYIVVTDANNVTASNYYQGAPPFTYSVATTGAACPALGTATATVSGGLPPYTYQWYDIQTMTNVGTTNPISLPAGQYGVTITDANGCVWGSMYYQDSTEVPSIPAFSYPITTTAASCTNGTATVGAITGGTPPYSYLWSNAATTASINSLVMGSYNVTVTDALGCSVTNYTYIQQTPQIGVNTTPTPATCTQNDGAAIAFGSGGVPPYTYLWTNGGTTQSISNLLAGYYGVTLTDANGCIGNGGAYVSSSTPVTATYTTTPSSCTAATGSATLTVSGGVAPYIISWSTFPAQTGLTASNLSAGSYHFHITDANGCVRDGSVNIPPIDVVTLSLSGANATCLQSDGSASVTASGGTLPYSYLWTNGGTTASITNLAAGNYGVTVTDANGCNTTKNRYVASSSPVSVGLASTPATCIFAADGSVNANPAGGTLPYTYAWNNGPATQNNTSIAAGYYSVYVTDAVGCTASAFTYLGYNAANNSCYCTITGTIYDDVNGNCIQDAGELGIQNIQVHCSNVGYAYTDANGVYSFIVPTGSYTITETVQNFYPLAACQANGIVVNVTAAANCVNTVDFANSINPIHDMHISTWDYTFAVPGNTYQQKTIITNDGTVAESNLIAGYTTDGQVGAPSFVPGGIFAAGPPDYYDIPAGNLSLNPGASQDFYMNYTVPTNIPLNTSLVFKDSTVYTSPMSNWLTDYTPWNNVNYFTTYTMAAYDPNFKEVKPKGVGPTGLITYDDSTLEYMVHFQNIGNYKAQNVVVIDTLDADLDWTTLHPVYQSHPCVVTIDELGVAKFTFNNINLPAEMNDAQGSNGMFTYTIKTKPNLPLGTQFTNNASIYFDFNAPVVTNTTVNTLYDPSGVKHVALGNEGSFFVHPNPASGTFSAVITATGDAAATLSLTDISGRVLMSRQISVQKGTHAVATDINHLSSGIYFVNLNCNNKLQTQKLVIIK